MLKFSIIVPAYNEEELLPTCLESLTRLDFDKNRFEIILVNNNSNDKTKEIAMGFSGVKVLDEPKQGNVHALIKGCRAAQGEIFLFTDADTVVPRDWLKKYERVYSDAKIVFCGGPGTFSPQILTSVIPEFILYWAGVLTQYAAGFNMSIRKDAYRKLGGFNPKINFNQDAYLSKKAKEIGQTVFLTENAVITSSRRYSTWKVLAYVSKTLVNMVSLQLFGRTVFFDFGEVRNTVKPSRFLRFRRRQ